MPFFEAGAQPLLKEVLDSSTFHATTENLVIAEAEVIIVCIGTPLDEHMSPVPRIFIDLLESIKQYLKPEQLLILRSTVYPGTTRLAAQYLSEIPINVAF